MVGEKPGLWRISLFYLDLIEILLSEMGERKGNDKVCLVMTDFTVQRTTGVV